MSDTTPMESQPVESILNELAAAQKRVDEAARAYQASERDREDFKKRMERERQRMVDVEKASIAVTLLEAIDELDLCLAAADASALAKGVKLIRDGLLKKALSLGLERLDLLGSLYDANRAEASDVVVTTDAEADGTIVAVERPAYTMNGRVVRPGRVSVAKYMKPADA